MQELNRLSLTELLHRKQLGQLDLRELIADCQERVACREEEVQAFEFYDEGNLQDQIANLSSDTENKQLYGIPFGVKDIIDTHDMPTTWGSPIYKGHRPVRDAGCVTVLRNAGAVVFGKTVSTEFAFLNPGKTRNPHNMEHTPGGSSQGSAAAVADYMIPFALGTQTAASVIRPAAFCGVVGYKSSAGEFDLGGVCGLSQSMDSLGFFVRDSQDLRILRSACLGVEKTQYVKKPSTIGIVRTSHWELASESNQAMIRRLQDKLEGMGVRVPEVTIGPEDDSLVNAQKTVMAYETARSRIYEYVNHPAALSSHMQKLIEEGLGIDRVRYVEAQQLAAACRVELSTKLENLDFLITPSTPGEAPHTLENTGDPIFSRMWTVMGVPAITLPSGKGDKGLPLGIQLVGGFRQDDQLIEHAVWFQQTVLSE